MNKLKFILFLFILLPLCVKPIVLDSLQKEELIKQGIFKLNELKASNLQKIHEGKTGELNFIVNLSPDNNTTDYINDYNLATKPHFLFDPTLEQQLNSRLQQVYVNQNKECYLILVSAFDVEIKAPIPTGLTIQDVFNKGKFFDEQSDIETHKNFHNDVVTQIANNSSIASNNRNCYILSVGAYCGVFFKNENPGCYYYWFAKKVSKSTNPAVPLFEETYDYLNTYLINSNDFNHPTSRDNIAEQLVTAFESAAKNAQLKAQILTTNSTTGVSSILNQFTKAEDYSTLSVAERIHILQVFTGESMGNAEEILTLNILKNTPSSQYQGILDGLKNTSNNFSDNLISLLSWRMDGDNFVQYIQTITIWIAQKYPTDETSWVQILQRQDRARRTVIGFSSSILDGTANTVSYSGNDICFEVTNNFQIPITTITKCSDIYGYVLVKFNSDFSFNERDFKAGEIVKMPALYAHLLFNKSSNDKLKTVGKATLNLVMFTVGVGEISTAVTSYETTVALLDMGVVTTDLIINEGLADTLKNSPEGLMFLDVWNKVDLIYGGVRIATELATQFRNYGTPLTSSSSLNAAEKQKINSMMTEVDDMVVNSAGSLASSLTGALKTAYQKLISSGLSAVEETNVIKLFNAENKLIAEIADNKLVFKYNGYGGDIGMVESKSTAVFGRFNDPIHGGGTKEFIQNSSKVYETGANPNGINILNISDWTWAKNEAWVIESANRGDIMRFISDPTNLANIYTNGISGAKTVTGLEIETLENLGYTWNASIFQYVK